MHRLTLLGSFVLIAFAASLPQAFAQTWPTRPLTFIVPFTPGSGVDLMARSFGARLAERLATNVVTDNRAGASGNIAHEYVARTTPDGHTLLMTAASFVNNPAVNKNLRYNPLTDFAPIALLATGAQCLVVAANAEPRSVKALIAAAHAQPGKLFYGSPGNGTPHHLAMELFKFETATDLVHVPYKGFAGALNDLVAGRLATMMMPLSAAATPVRNNQVRVLAVIAPERATVFPDVPTIAEEGFPGVQASNWYAFLAPAGTPPAIVARLNAEANAILGEPAMRETLVKQGFTIAGGPPARLAALLRSDLERARAIAERAGIKAD